MILIFDTETTGLPNWKVPSEDPTQPHLVQLACGLFTDEGREVGTFMRIVLPTKFTIPAEATAIHGINDTLARDCGTSLDSVVVAYTKMASVAELRVAHNTPFDDRVMRIALLRCGFSRAEIEMTQRGPSADTCAMARHVMKNERELGRKDALEKADLASCMAHFFNDAHDGAHDALADMRACARLYFHFRNEMKVTAP